MAESYVYRELTWTCPHCTSEQTGGYMKCYRCGANRGEVEFSDENSQVVTDVPEIRLAESGPDWVCGYCSTTNRNVTESCQQCGASNAGGRERKDEPQGSQVPDPIPEPPREPERPIIPTVPTPVLVEDVTIPWGPPPSRPRNPPQLLGPGLVAAMITASVLGLLYWAFFDTRPVELTLKETHWARSIDIERLNTLHEEDWTVPTGGRVLSSHPEIHHHDQVQDGYTTTKASRQVLDGYDTVPDTKQVRYQTGTTKVLVRTERLKNGYARDVYDDRATYGYRTESCTKQVPRYRTEYYDVQKPRYRDVPVYHTKYSYEIDRWQHNRNVISAGSDQEPKWGDVVLGPREREGVRTGKYWVVMKEKANPFTDHEVSYSLEDLERDKIGSSFRADLNRAGTLSNLVRCP